jgi:hypothetical protein
MASHYLSLNRGQDGFPSNQYVSGTSSSANVGLELRLDDSAGYSKLDVVRQLEAFRRFFETAPLVSASGFAVKG